MLDHLDLNVADLPRSRAFYAAVLGRLGYAVTRDEATWCILARDGDAAPYLTLVASPPPHMGAGYHRKRVGLNHLAFWVPSEADVDAMHAWLVEAGVPVLYGGPMRMPPDRYAVFFEDPDRVKLEVVCRPGAR